MDITACFGPFSLTIVNTSFSSHSRLKFNREEKGSLNDGGENVHWHDSVNKKNTIFGVKVSFNERGDIEMFFLSSMLT
jgi:hypothetical protein